MAETPPVVLEPDYVVQLFVKPSETDDYPSHWVGRVQAVDERGIRIRDFDWLTEEFLGFDRFVPWSEIRQVRIAVPHHHDLTLFLKQIVDDTQQRRASSD